MHQEKKRYAEIAKELKCSSAYVTKLLKYYCEKHGIKWVDGRSLRHDFPHQNRKPGLFKQIADQVVAMYNDTDLTIGEIAKHFGVHPATIKKAIRWWHGERGLPVPNGRTRAGRLRREADRCGNAS
jgi:transposase